MSTPSETSADSLADTPPAESGTTAGKAGDAVQPRLGALGWARFVWRQLTSMRTALLLLLLLAIAAVPGSVFPQRRVDAVRVADYLDEHATTGPWLDRLGFFDVYASPWFAAVYLLLFVSLVGCVVPRARLHARALRARPPRVPRRLARMPVYRTSEVTTGPGAEAALLAAAARELRRRRYRVDVTPEGVCAERGYSAETGNLLFHLALLGVLVAVAYGSLFSWSGQAVVITGKGFANALPMYQEFRAGLRVDEQDLPPFSFTLDRMRVEFNHDPKDAAFGAPEDFAASLTVTEHPGEAARRRTLRVNAPLTLAGTRIYLVGNGYAPEITVRDGAGNLAFSGPVIFTPQDQQYTSLGVVKVPDARPRQLAFSGFLLPTAVTGSDGMPVSVYPDLTQPRLALNPYAGRPGEDDLGLDSGVPQSVFRLDADRLTQLTGPSGKPLRLLLAPGETATLPGGAGTVTFEGVRRYAALDLHRDPSKGWALGAATAALAGLLLMLFVRRRRIWVRVVPSAGQGPTVVEAAGLARGEDRRLADEVAAVLDGVRAGSGSATPGAATSDRTTPPPPDPAEEPR